MTMSPRQRAPRVYRGTYLKLVGTTEQGQVFVLQSTVDSKVSPNLVMKAASQKASQSKGRSTVEDLDVQSYGKAGKGSREKDPRISESSMLQS